MAVMPLLVLIQCRCEHLQGLFAERGDPAGFAAERENLVESDFARPGAEVRAGCEVPKTPPHHEPRFLQHILGVARPAHQTVDIGFERRFVLVEEPQKIFGPVC